MLNTQLFVQHLPSDETVRYTYYEKACTSPQVIMFNSAMPTRVKIQTLANETVRRMRNSDRDLTPAQRAAILTNLSGKMALSGYPEATRRQAIQAGLQGYYRLVKLQRTGSRRVNRTRDTASDAARLLKKALAPSTWFREPHLEPTHLEGAPPLPRHAPPLAPASRARKRPPTARTWTRPSPTSRLEPDPAPAGDQTPDTVLFIPSTPRSQLANALKRIDRAFIKLHGGQPIRVVERTGPTIAQLLSSTDLWL